MTIAINTPTDGWTPEQEARFHRYNIGRFESLHDYADRVVQGAEAGVRRRFIEHVRSLFNQFPRQH
jgi:hypothetical protein